MATNPQNEVNWDNVSDILTENCQENIEEIKKYYNAAEGNIKKGVRPSEPEPGEPSYKELKKSVEDDLQVIDTTKKLVDDKLEEIKGLRQTFQQEIAKYDTEIDIINAQIKKIEDCLSQYPEESTNENIIELRQHRDELKNLLNGFQSQREVLIKKAQEIESFPSTLFPKGSPPRGKGMETSDPRLLMAEAEKISSKLKEALTEICTKVQDFLSSCKSILNRAQNFFNLSKSKSDQLINKSNSLMDNLMIGLTQKTSMSKPCY